MKKVLIATTNTDKYNAVSKIFNKTIFPNNKYSLHSLKDVDKELIDEKEIGNNIERARVKAKNAYDVFKDDFDYIVGLDDAIRIKGELHPNIKDYINKILFDNFIDDGEEYSFNRAYCIMNKKGKMYETNLEIPYIYHDNNSIKLEEQSYPLSRVAYPIGYDKSIDELNENDEVNYYLKYVKDGLMSLKIEEE